MLSISPRLIARYATRMATTAVCTNLSTIALDRAVPSEPDDYSNQSKVQVGGFVIGTLIASQTYKHTDALVDRIADARTLRKAAKVHSDL